MARHPAAAIVIPARYASQRFPGKPLAPLIGADGVAKPLIRRSWEAAMACPGIARVLIATDDARIAETASAFGADVAMTPEHCANGTERCAAVLEMLGDGIDIVVNLQGDAPLTPDWFVEETLAGLVADEAAAMATPAIRCSPGQRHRLIADQQAGRVGGTTAVFAADGRALYFSKRVIPYLPEAVGLGDADAPVYLHIGVYAYRRAALARYAAAPVSAYEMLEGLEQLRFLDRSERIAVVEVDARGRDIWELNNPHDTGPIERELARLGIA